MNMAVASDLFIEEDSVGDMLAYLRKSNWLAKKGDGSEYSACLAALMVSLNTTMDPTSICEALPQKDSSFDLIDVLNSLSHLNYIGRSITLRVCDLDERLLPCLFIPRNAENQPSVVMNKCKYGNEGHQTEQFSIFYGESESSDNIDISETKYVGTAYFFTKEEDLEQDVSEDNRATSGFSWFRALLERFRGLFWQVFTVSVILNIVALGAPLFIMLVYDKVISAHSPEILTPLMVGAVLALGCEAILRKLRLQSLVWFGARLDNIVSNKIFEQLSFMPPIFTERASVASQMARLRAFESVRDFFSGSLFLALIELPFTLLIIGAIAIIGGYVALIPITTALFYLILLFWMRPKLKIEIRQSAKAALLRQQMAFESFEKMHGLRVNGLTSVWFKQFRNLSGKASLIGFRASFIASIIESVAYFIFILSGMLTVALSIERIWVGEMSTGAMIACMILVWRVLGPFQILCNSLPRFEQLNNAIEQVNRLMDIKTEQAEEQKGSHIDKLVGEITFSKVGLRYTKNSDPVFAGLNFDAKPGQLVVITGGNGSGKSTILKLVNGLYRPQAGSIRVDGLDIRQLDSIELRKKLHMSRKFLTFFEALLLKTYVFLTL
ncbi:hypothetical protein AB835_07965 [Candidatus Endobugula sertula]|uniref:ABC transmembrane type-1 domain-containing protein n=1 Tax=Candidatus Endobugula sertula TaxID=62101 RepID=A0A1D2QPX0_9GAMM|nr:hypothetical protein AB835_07965 [Candidatus Endobugula sertula]